MIDSAAYGGHLILAGLKLDSLPDGPPPYADGAFLLICDRIAEMAREIDNESIFDGGSTGGAVLPGAATCDFQMMIARVLQGESNVFRVFYEGDDSGILLSINRPSSYRFLVVRQNFGVRVHGGLRDNVALERLLQVIDVGHDSGLD